MKKLLNVRYVLLHCAYWGSFCVFGAYAALFLGAKGISAGSTGVLLAATSGLTAVCQPVVAARADRGGKFSLKELTILLAAVSFLSTLVLIFAGRGRWLIGGLFCLAFAAIQIMQPLITSIGMYYINRGENVNYGLARGIGSAAYAAASTITGVLTAAWGAGMVPVAACALGGALALLAVSFHIEMPRQETGADGVAAGGYMALLRENPRFGALLVGVAALFTFHFISNTYMYQIVENVGGTSSQMGIATSIAAVCELPVMFLFTRIAKRIPVRKLLRLAGFMWFVKSVGLFFCGSVTGIYLNQILQFGAFGLYVPAGVYYSNSIMREENKVKGQAMLTIAFTIGSILGNLLGGLLIDWSGVRTMLLCGIPFTAVGTVLLFAGTRE